MWVPRVKRDSEEAPSAVPKVEGANPGDPVEIEAINWGSGIQLSEQVIIVTEL